MPGNANSGRRPNIETIARRMAVHDVLHAPGEPPPRPVWLEDDAAAEWDRVVGELSKRYSLNAADCALLAAYCQTFANWLKAERTLKQDGQSYVNNQGNYVLHPLAKHAVGLVAEMRHIASQFGFTPASRARLAEEGAAPTSPEDDDFERGKAG